MRKFAALAVAGTLTILAAPAQALEVPTKSTATTFQHNVGASPLAVLETTAHHHRRKHSRKRGRHYNRGYNQRANYDRRGRYVNPRQLRRGDTVWQGRNGDYYCKRDNGTTGAVIGAGLGALGGRTVDTRGDRSLGTLLGAVAGGLLGRELTRGKLKCR